MKNKIQMTAAIWSAASVFAFFVAPSALGASPWQLAVKNLDGGGYWKVYTSLASCENDQFEGEDCEKAINNCGSYGADVYMTTEVMRRITDADFGNIIAIFGMNGEEIGSEQCRIAIR